MCDYVKCLTMKINAVWDVDIVDYVLSPRNTKQQHNTHKMVHEQIRNEIFEASREAKREAARERERSTDRE